MNPLPRLGRTLAANIQPVLSSRPMRAASTLPLLLSGLLLAACSSAPPAAPPVDARQVDSWVMRGYLSDTRRSVEVHPDQAEFAGSPIALEWLLPDQGRQLPWVVYLPGLGENEHAGDRWRRAWAAAGYAVLAVASDSGDRPPPELLMPVDTRAASGTGQQALELRKHLADLRDALHEWARQRYRPELAAARLRRLAAVLAGVAARKTQGDPGLARIDTSQVALAGYDIGAYTVALAAGEQPTADWTATPLPVPLAGAILLSPYADFGGTGFAQRYRAIQAALLSVSGPGDQDSAGVVPSPFVRRAPFENLPGGGALLWLDGLSHLLLSGDLPRGELGRGEDSQGMLAPGGAGSSGPAGGRGGAGGSRGGPGMPGGARMLAPGADERNGGRPRSPTEQAIDQAIVAATSTAFLDARLKRDRVAREWLDHEAARWVGRRGEWRQRP